MDYIQVSAKTVEDAVLEAAMKLATTREHLEYEVIEKGSAGFLGIGAKQAVIKAWKKQEKKENKKEAKKVVEEPKVEEVVATESIVTEQPKKVIIAKTTTPFRKLPTMLQAHVVGQMPVGTAFEIVMTVNNAIGTFYKLNNGKYITAKGNYTIQ